MSNQQRKWLNNSNSGGSGFGKTNNNNIGAYYNGDSPFSSYSSQSASPINMMGKSNDTNSMNNNSINNNSFIKSNTSNNSSTNSHTPQIGSFTQNYELYSMNKLFSINSSQQQQQQTQQAQQKDSKDTSNQFINRDRDNSRDGGNSLKRSNSSTSSNNSGTGQKSLSDHFLSSQSSRDDHHFNKYGVHPQGSSHHQQQQQQTPQATSILLLAQCGSDDHTFTAMYCSNDYLIFRYVGQSIVPFYKCLKWDKDPSKKIVSMCFDPSAIWLLCLLNDTSCKVIPIYYDMCKKVGFIDDNNNKQPMVNHRPPPEKTDRLSNWVSTSRLFKLSSSNVNKDSKDSGGIGSQNNLNNLTSANSTSGGGSGFSKFKIPQLTKKTALGSNCLWWKTSNSVDYAIITTTSNNIYFVNLVDNSVYKHRFEYSIEKIEMVQSDSETFLLIATRSNGYYQLLIEQKIDHHKYETIIQLGNQPSNSKSSSSDSHSNVSRSSDFNIKTLFQTDRNPSDRVLLVQKTNINQHHATTTSPSSTTQSPISPTVSSSPTSPQPINGLLSSSSSSINSNNSNNNNNGSNSNENVVVSFLRSTSKLEIYEPLYLNKYPLFVYQLPANTTNFFFTKHITIVSEVITTLSNGNEAIQRSNVSILSNLVAGTASNSKFINNQSIMQTFQLAPGETILGISKSLNHHHSNSNNINNSNNNNNNNNTSYNFNNSNNIFSNNEEELMKYTKIPTVSLWTNFAIYELRQKKSPEEIFFELVSCNLEKSDGEALGKTFGLDLLSCYEAAADIKFDQGQYGRALDLYYLSGVRTNKLVFKFLEIGRMDIIMTHLKAILHQPDSFNVLDRKKISDLLFQCYLYKLLSSKDDFKSLEAEFYHFLSSNQDYAEIKALLLLSSNGLLDYFFSVAHSRRIMPTALQMLIESDILHLDAQNISFLQSAYSHELKSHANGMIFDCLPPKLQVKLIIDDQQTIPRYLRRLYHIISLLDEKELLDIAETFDPLVFTPPGTINQKLVKSNQFSHSNQNNYYHNLHHQHQQQQQHYQQQQQQQHYHQQHHHHQYNNNNILSLEDAEFENNSTPGRQSESIPIKDEEYFELYLITLLTLIYKRNQKDGSGNSSGLGSGRHRSHRNNESKQKQQVNKQEIPDNESTTTTTNTNSDDENSSNTSSSKNGGNSSKKSTIRLKPDPELMIHPMQMLKNEKRALKVSCGWDHVVVIGEDGELYTWGNNTYGQCGHGLEIGKMQTTPKRLEFFRGKSPIIMAECGGDHTIAVDSNYTVYSWGSDKFGQLGHGTKSVSLTRPKIIEELSGQKIQAIAAGYAHTIVLKKSGELFSFGYGEMGQLGHGSYSSKSVPTRIEINTIVGPQHHGGGKITLIACGYAHSVFCTDNGEVYTWGYGKKGQLGHGSFENISRPRLVDALKGVTKISCGHFYTIATTDLKNVYSWGAGEHMKLGHGQDKNEAIPRVVDFFIQKNVSKIVCGLNHTITLTFPNLNNSNSNDHESDDDQDFNGDGNDDDPDFNGFTHIGGGNGGRTINNSNNSNGGSVGESSPIYAWGEGEHGKLGLGGDLKSPFFDKPIPTAIKGVNALNLMDISCGSDFTAMITTNGSVYVWGFGRFGQIGNGKNEDAWVPIRISLNDSKSNGLGGGAGGIAADNKKQRYTLDGLEDTLRSHVACYRPFHILNKAKQFENYDVVAVIYDILNDHLSTLEYRLLSLEKKCLDKDKELPLIFNMLSNYFIKELDGPTSLQQTTTLSTSSSSTSLNTLQTSGTNTPILSSSSSSSSPSPSLNSSKGIDQQSNSINTGDQLSTSTLVQDEKLLKFNLISMIFNYYKKKDLPISDLEAYLSTNIDHFSELLSSVIQFNNHLELPLILNFTPLFYINTLKNYLQNMKNQSEIEKSKQKVSEKILWQNINENLEKNLLQRSKIEIPTLNQDIYSSLNISSNGIGGNGSSVNSGGIHTEKDIAFTCNHFFSKRTFYGSTLPDFQSEIQKLSIPSQQTLDYIIQEYNKKSISQSCPICLFNSIRDIQNIDETRKDILKLFKLS